MRRPIVVLLVLAIAAGFAAGCASTSAGWTYAPPTEAPITEPPASGEASAAPSAAASEAPSAAPSEGSSQAPAGAVITITAQNIAWDQTELSAPADSPFTVHLNNQDAGTPHNVEIKDAAGMSLFRGEIITGVAEIDYQVPPLAAGTYQLVCTVHPAMVATLTVGG